MKKVIGLILIITLCFGLISCNSSEERRNRNLTKTSSIVSNNNKNFYTAEDEDFIYYTNYMIHMKYMSVKKMSKADNSITDIFAFDESDYLSNIAIECLEDRLYMITRKYEFISMDKNGGNILKTMIPMDFRETPPGHASYLFVPYILGDDLYLIYSYKGFIYRVDLDTLALELVDSEITRQYITSSKTIFIVKAEDEMGRIYRKPDNGSMELISGEDESVMPTNSINYTNDYVFYTAYKENDFNVFYLYRTDLDGKNKVLIKKFNYYRGNDVIRYDNEYLYLVISDDEFLKINKETLKETNIASIIDKERFPYEISNEKAFYLYGELYYIDIATGEKVIL